jgi:hypothetical protein
LESFGLKSGMCIMSLFLTKEHAFLVHRMMLRHSICVPWSSNIMQ